MGKVRVYSLAQELDVKSQELLDLLKEMNQEVPSHMSAIDDEIADLLRQKIKRVSAEPGKPEQPKQEIKPESKPDTRQESKKLEQPKTEPKKFDQPKHEQPKRDARPSDGRRDGNSSPEGRKDARPAQETKSRPVSQEQKRDGKPAFQDKKEKSQPAGDGRPVAQAEDAAQTSAPPHFDVSRKDKDREKNARKERSYEDRRDGKQGTHSGGHGKKYNKQGNRPARNEESKYAHAEVAEEVSAVVKNDNVIELQLPLTVKSFAEHLSVAPNQIIAKLIGLGVMATINQNLDSEAIELLAADFGKEVVFKSQEELIRSRVIEDRPEDLQPRPPIVTIMGHVDHGKTSLLDVIRHTNVTATEAGGITQHIGAYQAMINGKKITFLDTPGHEAFTAMRARGAQLTDIAILVVAADDGVMPQTIEAINHAKAAGIQLIVAVNKIDKDSANPDRVLQELTEHGLVAEAWGGDTICVNVSALKKQNIDSLLEMILLVAEMQELKANPNRPADGVVVEALLDKGRGPVATILVKRGTLRVGDPIIAGSTFGRVRAMISDKGERVDKATPSTPVVVLGLNDVPAAGDVFEVVDDDKKARSIADERSQRKRAEELQSNRAVTLDDLFKQIKEGEVKDLNLIIKADVQGSIEALRDSLLRLSTDEVRVSPIHTGVGAVNESDVMLASASNAIIIGFNVRPDLNAQKLAEQSSVEIRTYRIIYQAIDEVKLALEGLLDPEEKEVVTGRATVRAVFKVPKLGAIAGLYVTDGKINRNSKVRLLRNGVVIHEGKIGSLKRFQDDVKEVMQGYECGLGIEGYNDIKEGDEIEVFVIEEVRRTLD